MGNSKSKDSDALKQERALNEKLNAQLYKEKTKDAEIIKLLLLGAGESGKSTLFRQMIRLYGSGFNEKDLVLYIPLVHGNTVAAMKELCFQSDRFKSENGSFSIQSDEAKVAKATLDSVKHDDKITAEIAKCVETLWKDEGIRFTFANRSRYQLMDSADYFFNHIHRLANPQYMPSEDDLIFCRVRTTGIVENFFTIDENQFRLVDVGGQRNERKKWMHCFEDVTSVIFVVDSSEYDKVLYEDGKTNRMEEALRLFEDTAGSKWFVNTSFILFLNKRDLFAEKIQKVPLTVCFKDYTGPNTYADSLNFIREQFEVRTQKKLYVHITCATDSGNVAAVFNAVKEIIIQKHLEDSGLV